MPGTPSSPRTRCCRSSKPTPRHCWPTVWATSASTTASPSTPATGWWACCACTGAGSLVAAKRGSRSIAFLTSSSEARPMPDLGFAVESVEAVPFAAAPLLALKLRIENRPVEEPIHSIALRCQIQIDAPFRIYQPLEEEGLRDLFGERERWGK